MSAAATWCRSSLFAVERLAPLRGEHQPRLAHAAGVLEADQPVGDGVFPDGEMRAASPPGLGVGIAARRLVHPGEELLRQGVRGGLHRLILPEGHAGRSTVWISTFDSSVWCTGHLSAISISRLRCSASSGPSSVMARSMWSTLLTLVSQVSQSWAWIFFSWLSRTETFSSGIFLKSA